MKSVERRDPLEILPETFPEPIRYESHRDFVRGVLAEEVDFRARGTEIIPGTQEDPDSPSVAYRNRMNSDGVASDDVARGYRWMPGTELAGVVQVGLRGTEARA